MKNKVRIEIEIEVSLGAYETEENSKPTIEQIENMIKKEWESEFSIDYLESYPYKISSVTILT